MPYAAVIMVIQRWLKEALYHERLALMDAQGEKPTLTLTRIGDCEAPAVVAAVTYVGHKFARELEEPIDFDQPLKHNRINVGMTVPDGH